MPIDGAEVLFCNENPTMILAPMGSPAAVAVSFWRVALSPAGPGHVLALWRRQPDAGAATTRVYADNRELAHLVVDTFLQHFTWTPFAGGRADQAEHREARFCLSVDPGRVYRVACVAAGTDLVAEWRETGPFTRHGSHGHPGVAYGGAPLVVDAVVGFSDRASLLVDGRPLPGGEAVHHPRNEERPTAFVTLGETWSRVKPGR